jgi:phosphohistidine swiveling domain-containing protein
VGDVLAAGKGNDHGIVYGLTRVFTPDNTDESIFFEQGDIIICTSTDDTMMEYIKKCGALVIGSWEKLDFSHAETVAKALDIPLLRVDVRATDFISSGMPVTVDTHKGLLLNGYKK